MRMTLSNRPDKTPRGITEQDVWAAADALLLAGARPTIERVRMQIGRGSPNTVSPHLESWFARLGSRIADPRAFAAPPDVPEPVMQAARHFWESALALARGEADVRARAAEAERDAAVSEARSMRSRGDTAEATLQALRLAQAGSEAAHAERAEAQQREIDRLIGEQAALAARMAAQDETHRADLAAAVERAVQAERRAAADMDRERQARARAEQTARETRQQAELALADERARAQAELVAQVQSYSRLEAQAQVLRDRVGQMEAEMRRVRLRDRSDRSRAVASPLARLRERGHGRG